MRIVRSLSYAAALCSALSAQTTWIVDASNGPGTNFRDLPPAVAAASSGDTIIVRTGTAYTGVSTSKGLAILGEGIVFVFPGSGGYAVRVDNLPANETFAVTGIIALFGNGNGGAGIGVYNAQGRVHVQDVGMFASPFGMPVGAGILAQRCANVTITNTSCAGNPALHAIDSDVNAVGTRIAGVNAESGFGFSLSQAAPGLIATRGTVRLSRCTVTGGNGDFGALGSLTAPNSIAARISSGTVYVTGTSRESITAGNAAGFGPATAIVNNGTLEIAPQIVVQGSFGAAAITGSGTTVTRPIVSLLVTGGQLGGTLDAEVVSPAGDLVALFVGLPTVGTPSPWGPVYVDLSTAIPLVYGATQPAGEMIQAGLAVPNMVALRAVALGLQAVNFYSSSLTLEMSNAGVVVLR